MNTSWFSKNLSDAMLAGILLNDLENSFKLECKKLNNPRHMALFVRHKSVGRLHCEVIPYFSPSSEKIAKHLSAIPCPIPTPYDLSLKAGSEESWTMLFPDFDRKQ